LFLQQTDKFGCQEMNISKVLAVLAALFLLTSLVVVSSCGSNKTPPPNHPLSITAKFIWGNDIYYDEVAIDFTITNNQEKIITDVSVVLFYKIVFVESDLQKTSNLRRINVGDLSLGQGESYNRVLSFGNIKYDVIEAESVQGELFSVYTQFADGSTWGDVNLSNHDDISRDDIRARGVKTEITTISNPKR